MCRKILALYDICHDSAVARPSTCTPSRPVNSPKNDVYFGLQRCPKPTPCPESQYDRAINLPLVARTCSDACEQVLNPSYWNERRRTRRSQEYNPFLDRMLCLGRDARLYHVVTGECVAREEQFGDEPPVGRGPYVEMLSRAPWEEDRGDGHGWRSGRVSPVTVKGVGREEPASRGGGDSGSGSGSDAGPVGKDDASSDVSRSSTWAGYRAQLRALRERAIRFDSRGERTLPQSPDRGSSSSSWVGRHLVHSKRSKRAFASHES